MFDKKLFQRRKYIIKPEVQIKYLFLVLLLIIIISGISVYFVNLTIRSSPLLENLTYLEIVAVNKLIIVTVLYVAGISCIAVFVLGLIFLHRLTGPIYVLEKMFAIVSEGILDIKLKLRKTDELKDVAFEFQNMIDCLRNYILEDKNKVDNIKKDVLYLIENINIVPLEEVKLKLEKVKQQLNEIFMKFRV
ncbi:MAG: hypothetical protein ACK4WJ_03535 [Endomicrobiia bacterium]